MIHSKAAGPRSVFSQGVFSVSAFCLVSGLAVGQERDVAAESGAEALPPTTQVPAETGEPVEAANSASSRSTDPAAADAAVFHPLVPPAGESAAPANPEAVEAEVVPANPPPDIRLHAVFDEVHAAPAGAEVRTGELIVPADIGMPEVREELRFAAEPLAGPAQLESSSYETDEFGGVLRIQFDRDTGRRLEAWAREHLGQRIAVFAGDRLVTAEPVNEGLGRRILVPTLLPLRDGQRFDWDGRDLREQARDARDEEAFTTASAVEQEGKLDWLRRGVSVSDAMDSALDGDVLSNRLLAWLALNSGAEGDQHRTLARLCWLAARDQYDLWTRLIEQWPDAASHDELRGLLASGRGAGEFGVGTADAATPGAAGTPGAAASVDSAQPAASLAAGVSAVDPASAPVLEASGSAAASAALADEDGRWVAFFAAPTAAQNAAAANNRAASGVDELEGGSAPNSPAPGETSPHAPPAKLSPADLEADVAQPAGTESAPAPEASVLPDAAAENSTAPAPAG